MANELVVHKSNNFIEAQYKLTLDEMRILLLTLGTLNPKEPTREFEFTVAEFAERFNVKESDAYKQVSNAIDKLGGRWAYIEKTDKIHRKVTFLTEQVYFVGEGRFQIILHEKLMPYVSLLQERFTHYNLKFVSNFSGFHAIRFYELMAQYRNAGYREISVEDLKEWLQIPDKYDRYNSFNQRVLTPAVNEINEKSDLKVTFEPVKRGRKIIALKFSIDSKFKLKLPKWSSYKGAFLNTQNPKLSNNACGQYFRDCAKAMDDFYNDVSEIDKDGLKHYWIFCEMTGNRSKFGGVKFFTEQLKEKGYKIVDCELQKLK